jgi:poly(3-hydroxybutyrate) depolymerase
MQLQLGCLMRRLLAACVVSLGGCGGGSGSAAPPAVTPDVAPAPTVQEQQCYATGWAREVVAAQGRQRLVLWKAPPGGSWARGALIVMHGGGGSHTNFCVANVASIAAQVRFTELALARGFAVFLLDSSDQITDNAGRLCGKVWDDEVRARDNLDLPFIDEVLGRVIPGKRTVGSRTEIFVTGHSSGAFMTVRAASQFADRVSAFAPVAGGDPYGWFRDCTPRPTDRPNVFGAGFDAETRRQIIEPGACTAPAYPNEKPWDGASVAAKPPVKVFHHAQDGIVDASCVDKLRTQLSANGFPQEAPLTLQGGARSAEAHAWLDAYGLPLLEFFESRMR